MINEQERAALRDRIADSITHHPGNRVGTPESRHGVSLVLAAAILKEAVMPFIEGLVEWYEQDDDPDAWDSAAGPEHCKSCGGPCRDERYMDLAPSVDLGGKAE